MALPRGNRKGKFENLGFQIKTCGAILDTPPIGAERLRGRLCRGEIYLVGREKINKNIVKKYGWRGSEVTRKFLPRKFENKKWQKAPITLACARHIGEFFFLVEKGKMVSETASGILKELLLSGRHFEDENVGDGLPKSAKFYRKGGWFESKLKDGKFLKFNTDAGIVEDGDIKYIIAILSSIKTKNVRKKFR